MALPSTGLLSPVLLYNASQSAPLGWYRIRQTRALAHGDLVAATLPEEAGTFAAQRGYLPAGTPVIKTVWGLEGDRVCEVKGRLHINGVPAVRLRSEDMAGRALPSPWKACRALQRHEILLLSDRTPDSFDGRYFGPVRQADIIGRAVWMGRANDPFNRDTLGEIGGRGECKIKAHGANEGPVPCLHIDFHGSTPQNTALWPERTLKYDNRLAWFHARNQTCFPPEQPE